jgi:hypothetical protein
MNHIADLDQPSFHELSAMSPRADDNNGNAARPRRASRGEPPEAALRGVSVRRAPP